MNCEKKQKKNYYIFIVNEKQSFPFLKRVFLKYTVHANRGKKYREKKDWRTRAAVEEKSEKWNLSANESQRVREVVEKRKQKRKIVSLQVVKGVIAGYNGRKWARYNNSPRNLSAFMWCGKVRQRRNEQKKAPTRYNDVIFGNKKKKMGPRAFIVPVYLYYEVVRQNCGNLVFIFRPSFGLTVRKSTTAPFAIYNKSTVL